MAQLTEQAKSLLHKRQKLIKLADSSEANWDAVQEYESQDIASDDEDDKKIRNARAAANINRKQNERERQQQSSKKRCTTPNLGTPDNHLFSWYLYRYCFYFLLIFFLSFSGAPRARGAPLLRKYGNPSM